MKNLFHLLLVLVLSPFLLLQAIVRLADKGLTQGFSLFGQHHLTTGLRRWGLLALQPVFWLLTVLTILVALLCILVLGLVEAAEEFYSLARDVIRQVAKNFRTGWQEALVVPPAAEPVLAATAADSANAPQGSALSGLKV